MRVLLVEDEQRLSANIKLILEQEMHCVVDVSYDGTEGYRMAQRGSYDVIILDLMLPGMEGLEVLRRLRSQQIVTPILILTARSTREEIVRGLKQGADDYLTKPFDIKELMARCEALVRRSLGQASSVITISDLRIDTNARRVYRRDEPVQLAAMEYRVLEYLALHAGQIVSKAQIEESLYADHNDLESNVIEVYISALRKHFDPHVPHQLIHTIRRQGYLLERRSDAGQIA
ncbi:MAG: response regulator transcription factor [Planctomycetes bacterium]|nr:response regulator transcription factor [Planctomycetota bacterium]